VPSYTYTKKNKLQIRQKNNGFKVLVYTSGVLIIVALFIQLYVMSIFAPKGDEIAKYESKRVKLLTENKDLHEEIAESRKLEYIRERSQGLGYVDITTEDLEYLKLDK